MASRNKVREIVGHVGVVVAMFGVFIAVIALVTGGLLGLIRLVQYSIPLTIGLGFGLAVLGFIVALLSGVLDEEVY